MKIYKLILAVVVLALSYSLTKAQDHDDCRTAIAMAEEIDANKEDATLVVGLFIGLQEMCDLQRVQAKMEKNFKLKCRSQKDESEYPLILQFDCTETLMKAYNWDLRKLCEKVTAIISESVKRSEIGWNVAWDIGNECKAQCSIRPPIPFQ